MTTWLGVLKFSMDVVVIIITTVYEKIETKWKKIPSARRHGDPIA